jgi:hypothetical protein
MWQLGCVPIDCNRTWRRQILWCASNRQQHQIPQEPLLVECMDKVTSTSAVRDLGIFLDSDASMRTHVMRTHRFQLLCCVQAASHRSSVGVKVGSVVTDRCVGQHAFELRQRSPNRRIRLLPPSAEHCCSSYPVYTAASARHATSQKSSLAQPS